MAKISTTVVNQELRNEIFYCIMNGECDDFVKINDRQYGVVLTDKNGVERYCRVGVIVAEEREDMTARELMQKEIDEYNAKQATKAEKAQAKAEKIARDQARREAKAKEKGD